MLSMLPKMLSKIAFTKVCIFDADENHVRTMLHNSRTRADDDGREILP
jgi:hypothetical protein